MMLTKRWWQLGIGLLVGLVSLSWGRTGLANTVGFEVAPVASKYQIDKAVSYYDLKLKPSQTTTLAVKVTNTSTQEITVHTAIVPATTNPNGVVEYQATADGKNIDLPADASQLITTAADKIILAKGTSKIVTFKVKMPAQKYDGVVVGGLSFLKKAAKQQSKSAMAIKNQYAYSVAVVLHGDHALTKNKLTLGKIDATQNNGYNQISLPLQNRTAAFLNQVKTDVQIYRRGSNKVRYKQVNEHGQMAPNSVYALPLRVGRDALKPGQYTAELAVTSKKQHWTFTKDFEITRDRANQLNKTAVIEHHTNWGLWISLGLLVILLLLIAWYIHRKQLKIKRLEERLKDKS
ncbi:DUF916 and DUF3324 domain-containing protein [Lactiplantibacillus plantarum]|uniref:DUF916 and DUF3324 domain-containing protein n=1 Tax=Lactiplantibacillus plantarum TaxID=1590 RepID=UPI0008637D44|nr:DUF916 and DUF3324 domain-containing protein [Lactiplantibacillus plantarum]MBA3077331.1 DUF916 and DUF3324 domain-containing protein [Lactiplantibacillus plantarum]MBA3080709.1 DUF916 and DUF3324 domain-containing protein [Lactiplantibacillus plantarum]MBA3083131.1 DUF916 and DUF3324 domain-containing protein [Lactiplantibacillus plantarum]MDT4758533.1 DUF916 and DUF3324 domain-containing protein [Lactiplantibacillus plantarum]MDY7131996.1 DUF916 and DUF3324 domain-containing protein [Lact